MNIEEQEILAEQIEAVTAEVKQSILPLLKSYETKGFNAESRAEAIAFGVGNQIQDWVLKANPEIDLAQGV